MTTNDDNPMPYIITDKRVFGQTWYVCARPGYMRTFEGKQKRDGTCPLKSGPEWTRYQPFALEFATHRAAARVANRNPSARIESV